MRRGLPSSAFSGRPQIAIANTASDLTPCNLHLNQVAEAVKRGVWEAGGVPLNLPMVSLGETLVRPTAMLWRNMAAMATEELLRANPVDGAVLLGGCDKTIPALVMGAASVDLPAVVLPGGPMLTGTFRGVRAGLRHRCVAAQRGGPGREAVREGLPGLRVGDDPQHRPLQHHGHGVHHGTAERGARADRARHGRAARPRTAGCWSGPTRPAAWPWRWPERAAARARSSPRPRSTTPSWPWPPWAARPTPWCTCWPSPAGPGCR